MCTVTIIPKGKNDFVLTSNRDEAPVRISLDPEFYKIEGVNLLFPKDKLAGGTWIGISEMNRVVCVLNGAFKCHERKLKYRQSRGVVAKDFMIASNIIETITTYNLEDIEPFTIVIVDWNESLKFYELVWDGNKKRFNELSKEPKIWSSSTLYDESMKAERLSWFETFKSKNKLHAVSLLDFHKSAGSPNMDYGVVMNRGFVKTTSITQINKKGDDVSMRFESLDNHVSNTVFKFPQVVNE